MTKMHGRGGSVWRFGSAAVAAALAVGIETADGQTAAARHPGTAAPYEVLDGTLGSTRALLERYAEDHAALRRSDGTPLSARRRERERRFFETWLGALETVDFDALGPEERVDSILFANQLRYELRALEHERRKEEAIASLLPFAPAIVELLEARRRIEPVDAPATAERLTGLLGEIETLRERLETDLASDAEDGASGPPPFKKTVANRAAKMVDRLRDALRDYYEFYALYDPLFTWWVREPHETLTKTLEEYGDFLRERLVGVSAVDDEAVIGDPVGRDELLSMLAYEMIPYTPEELVAIAKREYDWCRREMLEASRALGFGDDWHQALDHVKTLHVEPGRQPQLIREQALEAIEFLEKRDLLTIPDLCKETWRMEMMSPERQKVSPYFLGGEVIMVSFPTAGMAHEDKLMSLRGNNVHFCRAVVHHELIPGHHLQGFMNQRYRTHRRIFRTPFWGEGWALYWEMRLWDLGFPQSAEDRVGMLFWRMHRCARIVFSLSFHLEQMTADEAIEYLIENVGHERNNATAEVRRSVSGDYGPLYQAAYMLGGLQIRALHEELVASGRMSERDFHDTVLQQNSIPIEMVRAALTDQRLERDFSSTWRFYEAVD